MPALRAAALLGCTVGALSLGILDERNPNDLWVKALEKCGDEARDEDAAAALACQEQAEKKFESEAGRAGFEACDKEYCLCTRGVWANGVCTGTERCKDDCECMEQCYARQLKCSFSHTVGIYSSHDKVGNPCDVSKLTDCVRKTEASLIAECKRGLAQSKSFISWMAQPVAQGCNANLVCAAGATLHYSLLVLAAAFFAFIA